MRIVSPFGALQALTDRLPDTVAAWIWNVTYLLAWMSLPFTIFGTLYDLRIVLRFFDWLFAQLPILLEYLLPIAIPISEIVRFWRQLTAPLAEVLASLGLPFPAYLADFATLTVLLVPSMLRYAFQRVRYRASRELSERKRRELAELGGGGIGAGAAIGALLGSFLGPVGTIAGGTLGGSLAGSFGSAESLNRHSELSTLSESEARDERRLNQAKLLLRFSLLVVMLLVAVMLADGFWRPGG